MDRILGKAFNCALFLYLAIFIVGVLYATYVIFPIMRLPSSATTQASPLSELAIAGAELAGLTVLCLVVMKSKSAKKLKNKTLGLIVLGAYLIAASITIYYLLIPIVMLRIPNTLAYGQESTLAYAACAVIALLPIILHCLAFAKIIERKDALNATTAMIAFAFSIFLGITLSPLYMLAGLVLISVYDYIAVFKTKHMQFMAQGALWMGLPALFVMGNVKKLQAQAKSRKRTKKRLASALGAGDIIVPSAYFCSCLFVGSFFFAAIGLVGAIVGMYINFALLDSGKYRTIPALPLICISILLPTLIYVGWLIL